MNFRTIFSVLLICFSFVAFAQDAPNKTDAAGKKQGHWIKLDENKKKVYDGNFVNDIPVGKFIYYYSTGIVRAENIFSENGKVAHVKLFHPGGKLMAEGKYVNEKKDSMWVFYDEEAVLLAKENYSNGLKNGSSKVYYRNGQLSEEKTWKMGKQEGPRTKYFEDGAVKYKGQYINDKVEGKVTFYHQNGKVDAEGVYVNDLKNGDWKYYKEDGTLIRTDKYDNGRLTSPDVNVITKEQEDKLKQQYQDFEIKDPTGGNNPQ